MKNLLLAFSTFLMMSFAVVNLDKMAYVLYNSKGIKTNYDELLAEAKKADVILFG